jgi:hypothetical protein
MRRGAISREKARLKRDIAAAIEGEGVAAALSDRIAFQIVFKFDARELADRAVWPAVGRILGQEAARLRAKAGLADRQIVEVLPKLSARDVEAFLVDLQASDRRIARTIFNAALESAEPLVTGRRYLVEYQNVADKLRAVDPSVARTLANASFTASTPRRKAMEHLEQISAVTAAFARLAAGAESKLARTLASASRFRGHLRNAHVLATLGGKKNPVPR